MDQLKIQQAQQQIKQGSQDPLEQKIASIEKALGYKLNDQQRLAVVGLTPVAPGIDKTALRGELLNLANDDKATPIERRVYTSLLQDIDAGGDLKEIMGKKQAFQSSRTEVSPSEEKPVTEVFNNQRWQFDPGKKVAGKRDATGQYVLLGTAKEDTDGAGAGGKDISDWADDISSGQITVAQVPSKIRGDVLHYMTLHKQVVPTGRGEAQKAASDVSAAFKNWQNRQAALDKISWIHPMDRSLAKQAVDAALADLQGKAQSAVDAFGKANIPVPGWLYNYAPQQPNPANLVPVQ